MRHASFIFTFIVLEIAGLCQCNQLLHSVSGQVGRGNYTYYSLMYEGPISLHLYSHTGDTDLYVSQTNSKPTFDPDTYCLQSATCGVDSVDIPKGFKRPVGIGVYGHPSHESSSYLLEVVLRAEREEDTFDPFAKDAEPIRSGGAIQDHRHRQSPVTDSDNEEGEESAFWGFVWSLAELLLEGLLL